MCVHFIKMCQGGEWKIEIVLISRRRRGGFLCMAHKKMYIYFSAAALNVDLFVLLGLSGERCHSLFAQLTGQPIEIESSYLLPWIIFQAAINSRGVFINLSFLSLFQVSGEANYLRCLWQMKAVDVSKHARWQMGNQLRPTVRVMRRNPIEMCRKNQGPEREKKTS